MSSRGRVKKYIFSPCFMDPERYGKCGSETESRPLVYNFRYCIKHGGGWEAGGVEPLPFLLPPWGAMLCDLQVFSSPNKCNSVSVPKLFFLRHKRSDSRASACYKDMKEKTTLFTEISCKVSLQYDFWCVYFKIYFLGKYLSAIGAAMGFLTSLNS